MALGFEPGALGPKGACLLVTWHFTCVDFGAERVRSVARVQRLDRTQFGLFGFEGRLLASSFPRGFVQSYNIM